MDPDDVPIGTAKGHFALAHFAGREIDPRGLPVIVGRVRQRRRPAGVEQCLGAHADHVGPRLVDKGDRTVRRRDVHSDRCRFGDAAKARFAVGQRALRRNGMGNVADRADRTLESAIRPGQTAQRDFDLATLAGFRVETLVERGLGHCTADDVGVALACLNLVVGVEQPGRRPAETFRNAITGQRLPGGVEEDPTPVCIGAEHHLLHGRDERIEKIAAPFQIHPVAVAPRQRRRERQADRKGGDKEHLQDMDLRCQRRLDQGDRPASIECPRHRDDRNHRNRRRRADDAEPEGRDDDHRQPEEQ